MARLSPRQRQGLPRQQVDSRFPLCPKLLNAKDILRIPVTQTICLCRHQLYHNPDFSRNSENLADKNPSLVAQWYGFDAQISQLVVALFPICDKGIVGHRGTRLVEIGLYSVVHRYIGI